MTPKNISKRVLALERRLRKIRPLIQRVYNRDYRVKRSLNEGRLKQQQLLSRTLRTIRAHHRTARSLACVLGHAKKGKILVFLKMEQLHKLRLFLDRDNRRGR